MEEKKWYEEYQQVRTPDKDRLADIVTKKKGEKRTAAEYADSVEISPATLSRIMKGNYAKPLALDVLVKLAEGNDEVLKMLLGANGMASPEELDRRVSRVRMHEQRNQAMERYSCMQDVILSEILSKGMSMKRISNDGHAGGNEDDEEISELFKHSIPTRCAVEMQGDEPYKWYFIIISAIYFEDNPKQMNEWRIKRMIDNYSSIFLRDAWAPDSLKGKKISFVFCDRKFYERFLEYMKAGKIHNRMSAILVDLEVDKVVDETSLPCNQEFKDYGSPFTMESIDDYVDPMACMPEEPPYGFHDDEY